jgi:hypothetical protein
MVAKDTIVTKCVSNIMPAKVMSTMHNRRMCLFNPNM